MTIMEQIEAYYAQSRWWVSHLVNGSIFCLFVWVAIMVTPG